MICMFVSYIYIKTSDETDRKKNVYIRITLIQISRTI